MIDMLAELERLTFAVRVLLVLILVSWGSVGLFALAVAVTATRSCA